VKGLRETSGRAIERERNRRLFTSLDDLHYRVPELRKDELRKEYRRGESERAENSVSLAIMYPQLKTLTVDLLYFDREIVSWGHGLKYRVNLETAKSVLRFNCPSALCQGGDFELSKELRSAIAGRLNTVKGEVHCQGSRDQETGKTIRCETVLHYKMSLAFKGIATQPRRAR